MNCTLILEEYLGECKDLNNTAYVAFLDAKSMFDVVSHDVCYASCSILALKEKVGHPFTVYSQFHSASVFFRISFVIQVTWPSFVT